MDRCPSARGPYSIRPSKRATTFPPAMSIATFGSMGLYTVNGNCARVSDSAISSCENSGPRYTSLYRVVVSGLPANSRSAAPVPQPPSPMFGWMKMPWTPSIPRSRWFSLTLATTPRKHQVRETRLPDVLGDVGRRHLLEDALVGGRDVDLRELGREQAREVEIVRLDDAEPAVVLDEPAAQERAQDGWIAIGRQAHDLPLVPARFEAECRSHRLVERPERMRVLLVVDALDMAGATDAHAARQPRPVAVERDDERLVESALVIGIRCVGQVVLDALELAAEPHFGEARFQLLLPAIVERGRVTAPAPGLALGDVARDDALVRQHAIGHGLEQALLEPLVRVAEARHGRTADGHSRPRLAHGRGRRVRHGLVKKLALLGQVFLEEARLLVVWQERIDDAVELVDFDARLVQRVLERTPRKPVLQLHAREPFLSGGVRDPAVLDDGDRRVLVQRGKTQDLHMWDARSSSYRPAGVLGTPPILPKKSSQ